MKRQFSQINQIVVTVPWCWSVTSQTAFNIQNMCRIYIITLEVDYFIAAVNTFWPLISHSRTVWRYLTTIAFVRPFPARVCHNCILCGFSFHWHCIFHRFFLSSFISLTFQFCRGPLLKTHFKGAALGHLQSIITGTWGLAVMKLQCPFSSPLSQEILCTWEYIATLYHHDIKKRWRVS